MVWLARVRSFLATHIVKLAHFLAGALLSAYLMPEGPAVAFGVVVMAAILKEVHDGVMHRKVDLLDAAAAIAGGVLSLIVHWMPQFLQAL